MRWFFELKGNEKLHGTLILLFLFIITVLLLYIIFMVKEIEVFVDEKELYEMLINNIHCIVCHPNGG